ncbi:TPA: ATP-binding protein [Vibrio parahaemolyticus]|nr:ATP-binding protein [Vibrio parahaemolyticus]
MFKIEKVNVDGFWQRFTVNSTFNNDVNIIIGKNGTGKTTFINILHAILDVDLEELISCDFRSAEIHLSDGKRKRKISAIINDNEELRYPKIEYKISTSRYDIPLISPLDRNISPMHRRRAVEEREILKAKLSSLVKLASLSVYRLRNSDALEVRDRNNIYAISPVDHRLREVLSSLTKYQLELSQQTNEISLNLQKDVLASLLYSKNDKHKSVGIPYDFNKEQEKVHLNSAFRRLGAYDKGIREKINQHVEVVATNLNLLDEAKSQAQKSESKELQIDFDFDFEAIDAWRNTRNIIELSLSAEEKISKINEPIELLKKILGEFIEDKKFSFNSVGDVSVTNNYGNIKIESLSSGEKQLLILFIETLLQRRQEFIFLTDEPEISLHISWQRKIIPAVKRLNPYAQVIAATHSPEVAAHYKMNITSMEKMIHG